MEETVKRIFGYAREYKQNPYQGFTSFQHFRGGKLYSDAVAGAGNSAGCETENYECYPVTAGVEENGREQGFYPDTTVAYIRILWKEFEPEQGKYNYDFIQSIIDETRAHKQTLMFRIMPHSTCERDDVPEWLKKIVDCPARPAGKRVKDSPTDERYLELFGAAIEKFAEKFDDCDVLDIVDICLPGSWGEGYKLERYSEQSLKKFMDVYVRCFNKTHLVGQVASPELINYVRRFKPVGWRGDGTGSPFHMNGYFQKAVETMPADVWKTAPVSFESFWWLTEWLRHGWDIDDIIEKTLGWHLSNFNAKSFPVPDEWKDKIDYWLSKMGYHYVIDFAETSVKATNGAFNLKLGIDNAGVAPIYNKLPLIVKLKSKESSAEIKTDVDITKWLPGKAEENIVVPVPEGLSGKIAVEIGVKDIYGEGLAFATDAVRDGDFYVVGEVLA